MRNPSPITHLGSRCRSRSSRKGFVPPGVPFDILAFRFLLPPLKPDGAENFRHHQYSAALPLNAIAMQLSRVGRGCPLRCVQRHGCSKLPFQDPHLDALQQGQQLAPACPVPCLRAGFTHSAWDWTRSPASLTRQKLLDNCFRKNGRLVLPTRWSYQ